MTDGAGFREAIPPALDGERIDRVVSLLAYAVSYTHLRAHET